MKHLLLLGIVLSALHCSLSEIPEFCSMGPDEGDGSEIEMHLYYNAAEDRCVPFKYTGQGGNQNRFSSERTCMRNCSANAENVYPVNERNACLLVKTPGICKGHFMRFHYDAVHEKCKKFLFSGCGGNGNRFGNADSCMATCAGVTRDGRSGPGGEDEPEDPEPDTNVGAIVAAVLSVVLVAVVATIIALAVKSRKKKSKKSKDKRDKTATPLTDQGIEMS